jgi:hypothetical protein
MELRELPERMQRKIVTDNESGCWIWTGANVRGYGYVRVDRKTVLVHRYTLGLIQKLTAGLQVDHLCRNRSCCNPAHLEEVSPQENFLRSEAVSAVAARTNTCVAGLHTLDDSYTKSNGSRQCKACHKAKKAESMKDPVKAEKQREYVRASRARKRAREA